jgi:FMN reductase
LRGWPTPLGAGLNTAEELFDSSGGCIDESAALQLGIVGRQVVEFATKWQDQQKPD